MQIIAGRARGIRLKAPQGRDTRPTLGHVRESIFSMLEARLGGLDELAVLDAFAGSGALGLEAWSRGAAKVTFVEHSGRACRVIKENIRAASAWSDCHVVRGRVPDEVRRWLKGAPFDLVLLDPPYETKLLEPTLRALSRPGILADEAWIVVEHDRKTPPEESEHFEVVTAKHYGDTGVTLLHHPIEQT